jgi:hypothetical protein
MAPVIATGEAPVSLVPALMTGNTVSLTMQIDSAWEGYFNGTITLTNTGEKPIENWALSFSFPHTITNIWNGVIYEQADGLYTVKNAGWNQDIPVGGSVNFGFTAQQNGEALTPDFFFINTVERSVPSTDYEATYKLKKDWGTGFSGEITLKNISSQTIEDWSFSMGFARTITTASNTILTQSEGTQYLLNNPGYDQNISAGKNIKIGIQGTGGVETDVPSNFLVSQVTVGVSLTGDYDADGVKDYEELVVYGTDPLVSEETTPTPTPVPTLTPTPTSTPVPTPTSTPTPTPTPAEDMETDTDVDGLPDNYEIEIGTDPNLADTDSDGIDDMTELICGMDPLTSDLGLDFDEDGLTLQQEQELGKEFWNEDTDDDGLLDGEEINTYGTDPLLPDTDGDGLLDGDEILLGKNPLSADSDEDGIADGEDKVSQQISVDMYNAESLGISSVDIEMDLAHLIDSIVTVKDKYNIDMLSTGVASRIGSPISFECEEEFESATVVFHYDESALGETAEQDLGVLWYDEDNGVYVVQEQAIVDENANTVTLELEHFSTYVLVNLPRWIQDASATIEYDNTSGDTGVPYTYADEKYSYIFMVEDSAYFTESQRLSSLSIMREFVSHLRTGEQMTVGRVYDAYAYGWNSMTEDKALMNSALNYFMGPDFVPMVSTGTAYAYDVTAAVRFLRSHSANYNAGNIPVVILITTNASMVCNPEMYSIASECGGRVFAINIADPMLSNGMFDDALNELIYGSGGIPLNGGTPQQTWNNYINPPEQDPTIDYTDSDGDGLYDWLETGGMKGIDGNIYTSDPNTRHSDSEKDTLGNIVTDGDGLTDGQEMGRCVRIEKTSQGDIIATIDGEVISGAFAVQYQIYAPQDAGINYVFWVQSDPQKVDSDVDTYTDDIDESPFEKAISYELFGYSETGWNSVEKIPDFVSLMTKRDKYAATWGQNPDLIYDESVALTFIATDTIMNSIWLLCHNANSALDHYLDGTGTDYTISVFELICNSKSGSDQYQLYLSYLMDHVKSVLKDGDTLHIVSIDAFQSHSNVMPYDTTDLDWLLTLGVANGAFDVVASRTGDVYTIEGTYYVADTYDFDEGDTNSILPGISNGSMFNLHSAGIAQSYYIHGEFDLLCEFS